MKQRHLMAKMLQEQSQQEYASLTDVKYALWCSAALLDHLEPELPDACMPMHVCEWFSKHSSDPCAQEATCMHDKSQWCIN